LAIQKLFATRCKLVPRYAGSKVLNQGGSNILKLGQESNKANSATILFHVIHKVITIFRQMPTGKKKDITLNQ